APNDSLRWSSLGQFMEDMGRPQDAKAAYERAVNLPNPLHLPFNNLGVFYWNEGKFSLAIMMYQKALAIKYDPAVALNLAQALLDNGNRQEAHAIVSSLSEMPSEVLEEFRQELILR